MKLLFSLLLSFFFYSVTAQNSTNEILKQQMISDWERAKAYTREYLDAMPADKYGFRATDSIRSFAEQMLHFARSNAGFIFYGTGILNVNTRLFANPDFEKSPTAQNKDSVLYYVNTSYDIVIDAIKKLDFDKLNEVVTQDLPGGRRSATRLGWLMKAFEHQTHHRGQCTIYLRLQGIRPPAEKIW